MCETYDDKNDWKFCPYCGHKLLPDNEQRENKRKLSQEEFDSIFLGLLRKANTVVWHKDDGDISDVPTCNFTLRNSEGAWMFYIRLSSRNPIFMYSYYLVYKYFYELGLTEGDIQRLMKNQMKILFNMDGVTPRRTTFGSSMLQEIARENSKQEVEDVR